MKPFLAAYIFILHFARELFVLPLVLGIHFLLAVMAGFYIFQLPIVANDSSGGLLFILALFCGVPITLIASLLYVIIIVTAIIIGWKQKPLKRTICCPSTSSRLLNGLLSICLIIDVFYVLILFPQSLFVFWVLLNLRV